MKKIPTIFERDWDGDRSRVLDKPHPDCAWVFAGEGVPTRKLDGTCCMIRDGKLYKRREVKGTKPKVENGTFVPGEIILPAGFEPADFDTATAKAVGWMPVGDGPEDKWHRDAFTFADRGNGTYELIGPKVRGGAENAYVPDCRLILHNDSLLTITEPFDRTFEGIKAFLTGKDIEGIVFHHCDGRMAKIKGRDFGLKRGPRGA